MLFSEKKYYCSGTQIYVRILQVTDASERYVGWLNNPKVNQYLETRHATVSDIKTYIAEKIASPDCLFFGIFTQDTHEHIGNVKLEPIDWHTKKATLGILIGETDYWGKGIATEVIALVTDFAFTELGLSEVQLGVITENKAALRVYEKCGYTVFKIDANALVHGSKKYDQVWMHCLSKNNLSIT